MSLSLSVWSSVWSSPSSVYINYKKYSESVTSQAEDAIWNEDTDAHQPALKLLACPEVALRMIVVGICRT